MHNPTINKYLYKIFLAFVKYLPVTLALVFIGSTGCNYCRIYSPIFAYFGGTSFLFLGLLYIISYVFQFCHLYRIPLHYVVIVNGVGILNKAFNCFISTILMYRLYVIITGIALLIYLWFMYKNRNNPKIDHIKQLCDSYCRC